MAWNITVPLFPQTREQAVIALHAVNGPHAETPDWAIDVLLHPKSVAPMARVAQTGLIPYLVDGRLGEIKVPTSLIWGADDGLLPLAYAEALQKKIAGATLQIIDGAAHIPHRQQPEKFLACLNAIF
jgi:pimeloyl-ACP methyl ester carboxylesterase